MNVLGPILCFFGGCCISAVNWLITKKGPSADALMVVRTGLFKGMLDILLPLALFLLRDRLPFSLVGGLIAAAIGLSAPSLILALIEAKKARNKDKQ